MLLEEFWIKYWWIIVILIGIVLFYIYSKLDAYTQKQMKKVLSKRNLIIIGFVAGWYFWNRYGSSATISNANRWMPILLFMFLSAYNYIGQLQYDTQQLVTPNFHGCYSKPPKYINGFYIFAIDSFNAGGISWDFAKRIAIIREETVELFLEGGLSIAQMGFVSKYDLDDDCRKFIETNKFFKNAQNEIYYGWFDSIEEVDYDFKQLKKLAEEKNNPQHIYNLLKKELGVSNPTIKTLFWMYKNQCKATSKQTEQYDATVEAIEKGVEHSKRVKDAYVDKQESPQKIEGHEEY